MSKYKNKDGISLNYDGDDSHKVLVREVIREAIRILNSHAISDSQSKSWAIDRGKGNVPELDICKDLNVVMLWGVGGGKIQSSSWLINGGKDE